MKTSKVLNVTLVLIWILLFAVEAMTGILIWQLDLLPGKYLMILAGLFAVAWIGIGLMLLLPRKKKSSAIRCGAGCVLAALVVVGCVAVSGVVSNIHDTLDQVSDSRPQSGMRMAVYVRANDPAKTWEDAAGYSFAVMEGYEVERTANVITYLSQKLGEEITPASYNGITQMLDALYAEETDAIILNSSYLTILQGVEGYEDFETRTRMLGEVELVQQSKPEKTDKPQTGGDQPGEQTKPEDITTTPFVVYISGSDTRSKLLTTGNSDVNILVIVNPVSKQVLLLNTPRDYYIPNPAGGGALDKLTHCGVYGADCSMEALGALYDISVDYYAKINFTGFETLIDAIGGVTVYSDAAFSNADVSVSVGENYFNGRQALAFARERYQLAGGDNARGKNQMKVIKAAIQKMLSGTLITRYAEILDSLEGMFETDMSREDINKLVKMQLSDMASWDISSFAVTGAGDSRTTYSLPGMNVYVMLPDEALVAQAADLIDQVVEGKKLTEADLTPVH